MRHDGVRGSKEPFMIRMLATTSAAMVCVTVLAAESRAQAQDERWRAQRLETPRGVEVSLGSGYTQGLGQDTPVQRFDDAAGGGVGIALAIDYRAQPRWGLGVRAEYDELGPRNDDWARGFVTDLGLTYHMRPSASADPWIRLGAGYRLFGNNATTPKILVHGVELTRLTLGYDFRVDSNLAFAPILAADLDLFSWRYAFSDHLLHQFAQPQVGAFVFAGLQVRFEVSSMMRSPARVASP
jgi:hypothetical protein